MSTADIENLRWAAVISGGGRNGSHPVGALYRLVTDYGFRFQLISGTSTGALVAGPALVDNLEILNDIYRGGVANSDVLEARSVIVSLIRGYFDGGKTGLNGTAPLRRLIEAYTDARALERAWEEGRVAIASAVNLRTGKVRRFTSDPDSVRSGLWAQGVLASASMPFIMDPVFIDGDKYVDGGIVDPIPFLPALWKEEGGEFVARDDLDGIVVFRTFPETPEVLERNPGSNVEDLVRAIDLSITENARTDIPSLCEIAGKRVIVIDPHRHYGDSLDFDGEKMEQLWFDGFDRAGEVMEACGIHDGGVEL